MKLPLFFAFILTTATGLEASETARPNILFLIADDLATLLGCYGDRAAITPNIDRLAREGVVFNHAYAQGAVCTPSRTSFMLGLNNKHAKANHFIRHPETMTMGRWFREHGYQTCSIGKIDHDDPKDSYVDPKAWDVRVQREQMLPTTKLERRSLDEDGGLKRKNISFIGVADTPEAIDDSIRTDRAIHFFERERDATKPFFAAIGFHSPHVPWNAMREDFDQHDPAGLAPAVVPANATSVPAGTMLYEPGLELSEERQREGIQAYYAAVTFLDKQIGRLVEHLRSKGLLENTIIVFTSDHGYHLGWRGQWCKHTLAEQVMRVPLIVRNPRASKGASADGVVELLDLFPSFCDMASIPLPPPLDGKSFLPLLINPQADGKAGAFCQFGNGRTVRTLRWRLVERQNGSDELYDHLTDPDEYYNVIADPAHDTTLKQLRAMLESELGPRPPHSDRPAFPEFQRRQKNRASP